jgi:hypothetical protein
VLVPHTRKQVAVVPDFDTPDPLRLRFKVAAGEVTLRLTETAVTRVRVDGDSADAIDHTRVELDGDQMTIEGPRRSGLFRTAPQLTISVEAPNGSSLDAELQSSELHVTGELSDARVRSGSGDVDIEQASGDVAIDAGSGDVRVEHLEGDGTLRSGSGDLEVAATTGRIQASTGSGDVQLARVDGAADVRSGSGDVVVEHSTADLAISTASGDQQVLRTGGGTLRLKSASGDVHVGVSEGIAAWLDINTISGDVSSALGRSPEPEPDEPRVAVHVNTVSGDVHLFHA